MKRGEQGELPLITILRFTAGATRKFLHPTSGVLTALDENNAPVRRGPPPRQVCSVRDAETDKIALYCEPMPRAIGPLPEAMAAGLRVHKLILMDTKEAIDRVRPGVERLIGERATFTQVQPYRKSRWSMKGVCFGLRSYDAWIGDG